MTISANKIENENKVVIKVSGRFDYRSNREFRASFEGVKPDRFEIDLSQAEYMDSSALGMLLILREEVGGDGSRVRITGARADVRKILEIARFGDIFEVI